MIVIVSRLPPPLPLAPGDGRLSAPAWAGLLLGSLALAAATYLTPPDLFGTIDWVRIHGFYMPYLRAALRAGRLPLWNPYVALGRPFLADVDVAMFSPPDLPFVLLEARAACVLVIALHLALLLYGMARLLRALGAAPAAAWAAGVVIATSAPIVASFHSGLVHYGAALCYLPLILYLTVRLQAARTPAAVAALAIALGLQLLAGHPQAAWLTGIAAGLFIIGRRLERPFGPAVLAAMVELGALAIASAWALAIAGITVLPLAELMAESNRRAPTLAFASSFAMQPVDWATLLVPSTPAFSQLANAQLYVGAAPLLAGACGLARVRDRDVRGLLVIVTTAALIAAGTTTPAFALLYRVLPGLATMRIPARATVLIAFGLVTSGALLVSRRPVRSAGPMAAAGAIAAVAALVFVRAWPGFSADGAARGVPRALLFAIAALLLALALARPDRRGARALALLLALVTVGDLAIAAAGIKQQNRDAPERPVEAAVRALLNERGLLGPDLPPPRVSVPKPWVREDAGMAQGWSTFTGYAALQLARVWDYEHAVLGLPVPVAQNTYPSGEIFRRGPFPFDSMALVLGFDPVRRGPVLNQDPDPRAYLTPAAIRVADHREAIARMRAGHDFHRAALVEQAIALPAATAPGAPTGAARITHYAPEAISIETDSPQPALLVVAEAYYPGWEATVNGAPAPCLAANAWMRGVPVPAGPGRVELRFHSRRLAAGAVLSLAGVVAALAVILRRRS
jgi:hypothetical protein